jgi:Toxin PAAR-like domain/GHH signature containing HNH/Endo VII superfamily nuclease toxin  2
MANQVYANDMEVSCKAADGKSVSAFPDPCFTPPQTPATPMGTPIPYPNTGMATDCTDGSTTVQISGQEVMLKDSSYFQRSTGDEAGCAPKKGFTTGQNMGKAYFAAWSMDVKIEGENVVRHLDLMTHNHASMPGNTPTWPYIDAQANPAGAKDCEKDMERVKDNCPNAETDPAKDCECETSGSDPCGKRDRCRKAKRCMLVPKVRSPGRGGCCDGQTGHHLIPLHCFADVPGYNQAHAPCVCAEGWTYHRNDGSPFPKADKTHPAFHEVQDVMERRIVAAFPVIKARGGRIFPGLTQQKPWKYSTARNIGVATHGKVFSNPKCNQKCLIAQLDAYHTQSTVGVQNHTPLKAKAWGNPDKSSHPNSVAVWNARLAALTGP